MKKILIVLTMFFIAGCSDGLTKEQIDEKIKACSDASMGYTFLKDYNGNPYEVMCVKVKR